MTSHTLYLKTPHLNNFSRILCFILIGEKIAFIILVIASIAFQRVLIIRIKRNDYIPFRCRAITLNLRVWVTPSHDSRHSAASARLRVTFCGLAGYRPIPRSTKVRPAYRVSNMPTPTARNGKSPVRKNVITANKQKNKVRLISDIPQRTLSASQMGSRLSDRKGRCGLRRG